MRYTYRLRVSNTACRALSAGWGRCRWVWNECVAAAQRAYRDGEKVGPAALDKMLTRARRVTPWLREGGSVPQQRSSRASAISGGLKLRHGKTSGTGRRDIAVPECPSSRRTTRRRR
nr:helix-turn-helix domain-containing protein [Actinopolyspora biskrensis]